MERTVEIEFSKLRWAYLTVKQFLEDETLEKVQSTKTTVSGDLGCAGDDNYDMLQKFVRQFELEYGAFDYSEHFHSEGELFGSGAALWQLLSLSVWLPLKTIELLSLHRLELPKPDFSAMTRPVKDLTFREMIDWYVKGTFAKDPIRYKLVKPPESDPLRSATPAPLHVSAKLRKGL